MFSATFHLRQPDLAGSKANKPTIWIWLIQLAGWAKGPASQFEQLKRSGYGTVTTVNTVNTVNTVAIFSEKG